MRRSLLRSLNSLCEFLDDTYNINCGGCCFLSAVIATHLDKLGIDYSLVIYDRDIRKLKDIKKEICTCHRNDQLDNSVVGEYTCNHYCLKIKQGIINDYQEEIVYKYTIPHISCKSIRWIYKNGSWNDFYEIKNNNTIKRAVRNFFKQYEKDNNL